jgi:long-chain acyl-CoA synthetase
MTQGLLHGHTLVIATTADLDDLLRDIENYQITGFVGAPTIYDLLKNYEKTDQVNWKRLRYVGSGADALLEDTARGWERRSRGEDL